MGAREVDDRPRRLLGAAVTLHLGWINLTGDLLHTPDQRRLELQLPHGSALTISHDPRITDIPATALGEDSILVCREGPYEQLAEALVELGLGEVERAHDVGKQRGLVVEVRLVRHGQAG